MKNLLLFVLLALLAAPVGAQPATFTVPFHTVKGMVLVDATVNGKPAVLILDTGSAQTIVTDKSGADLKVLGQQASDVGVQLRLGRDFAMFLHAVGMNTDYAQKQLGAKFDGILGQDVLRDFSSVRIDYKANVVEFQK